jgi:hypothetical protein
MRKPALALLPACLLLAGAAPPQSALDALVECRMQRLEAYAALTPIPERAGVKPSGDGTRRSAPLVVPSDLRVFGSPIVLLVKSAGTLPGEQNFGILAAVNGPYEAVEKRALAGHGIAACQSRVPDEDRNCVVFTKADKEWRTVLLIQEFDDGNVGISCNYYRADD